MGIKKVIICGLGALGLTYASKLKSCCDLKILADEKRIENYKKNIPKLNGNEILLDYITPKDKFDADLIIISTKSLGIDSVIENLKNFVSEKTIIISLINGISSEEKFAKAYKNVKVVRSFFIGHSAMREGNSVFQDGIGKIFIEKNEALEEFFTKNNIDYEVSDDIIRAQWIKLGVNIILNQPSAIYELTVGELRNRKDYLPLAKSLLKEVIEVARAHEINNLATCEQEVLDSIYLIADDGKTSMYQDILAKRKTEVDIFSGEIIRLGKKYGIKTPYNEDIYNKIKSIEENY